jgi:diguanylate cyclase (GGDEF)-like protein
VLLSPRELKPASLPDPDLHQRAPDLYPRDGTHPGSGQPGHHRGTSGRFVGWRLGRIAATATAFQVAVLWYFLHFRQQHYYSLALLWNTGARFVMWVALSDVFSALLRIQQYVETDYLTDLLNIRGFHKLADKEIHRSQRSGRGFSVVYVDIDDFKGINDRFGHNAGDRLLRWFGTTFQQTSRRSDLVARLGGDEFAILLTETTLESSAAAITHFCDRLRVGVEYSRWNVTASFGVVTFEDWTGTVQAALHWADRLMYESKHRGGDAITHELVKGSVVVNRRTVEGCTTSLPNLRGR